MTFYKKQKYRAILIVMMTLGSTWAIRGRFGHEYGAAWAGSIGVLAVVLASGRKDWIRNWLPLTAIGAVGWGMTGMMSYGAVVGYGKSGNLLNTIYGLLCLFIIGGLFGFLGGGLAGMMLETNEDKKPKWGPLITQKVAGGIIVWGFLIHQLEWYMTPPRSELWAACLGAAIALARYMHRHRFTNAWYVAMTTMLGAGFGFAFGNFLQATGIQTEIGINWWNVMEYCIGFFGGLGMVYGVFSRSWLEMPRPSTSTQMWSAILLVILIPLWTITNSFDPDHVLRWAEQAGTESVHWFSTGIYLQLGITCLLAIAGLAILIRKSIRGQVKRSHVVLAFFISWLWYQILKLITSGILSYYTLSMEELTVINLIVVALLLYSIKAKQDPFRLPVSDVRYNKILIRTAIVIMVVLIILSFVASGLIDEVPGASRRFGNQ